MPDSWRITNALVARLQADAALMALMPDGAWKNEGPAGATRLVIVSLIPPMTNVQMFGGVAYKDGLYLVEARELLTSGSSSSVQAAAARLGVLLEDGDLTIAGYGVMAMHFEGDLEAIEVDDVNPVIRWHRCGGHLRLMVAPVHT